MNKNNFTIGSRKIGIGEKSFIIAEVAQNHDGSLGYAHSYIDALAQTGVDAVKFQTHIASAESTQGEPFRVNFSYEDEDRYSYWKRIEFTKEHWIGLKKHAEEKGLIFLSSVFSIQAAEMMDDIGMKAWKLGSGEINNNLLLQHLAKTGKPLLLSTGMSAWSEIDAAVSLAKENGSILSLFQCTSRYPSSFGDVGINLIPEMIERYNIPVGLSDHSGSVLPSILAIARGASLIEVHATFHKSMFGPDVPVSLTLDDLGFLCDARDAFYEMDISHVDKDIMASSLLDMRLLFNKSVALISNQQAGTVLTKDMLTTKKPGTGIPANQLDDCVGKKLLHDSCADKVLFYSDLHTL